jgi:Tfp pilus assembly protein PilF
VATEPRVSVLLPTHNRPDTLGVAIQSVLAQTLDDFELLIVCDGVADDTRATLARIDDPRIRCFDLPKATNFGYANRNVALREARGALVAFAADDDLWLPDHLAIMVRLFDDEHVEWVHSRPVWVTPDGIALPIAVDLREADELYAFLTRGNVLPAACVVHRRYCLEKYGYWPEDVAEAGDWGLWRRIINGGDQRNLAATRVPTCLHFRARRKIGDGPWGPPPLAETEETARREKWWPDGLRLPVLAGLPEQVAIWESIAASPSAIVDGLREATVVVFERLAKACLTARFPEHRRDLRPLSTSHSTPPREVLSSVLFDSFTGASVRQDIFQPLCMALIAAGQHEAALTIARLLNQQEPVKAWTWHILAIALSEAGSADQATESFERALELSHRNRGIARAFGRHLVKAGKPKQAIEVLHAIVSRGPRTADLLDDYALALDAGGDLCGAEKIFGEAATLDPNNSNYQRKLADIRSRLRRRP